jgi:diguanylate cyclase (GGDEF)-like protein
MLDRVRMRAALEAAPDVRAASEALVAALAGIDGLLPSIWLERGGRLRCQAVRGYRQIRDGVPPSHGVVGRAFSSGRTVVEPDVAVAPDYQQAAPEVVAEVCVPVGLDDRVVGCLNVEALHPIASGLTEELEWCARAYALRLGRLGGPPASSPAERLVAYAVRLAALEDPREIERLVLDAARDLSAMSSALLLARDDHAGRWSVLAHAGELGRHLSGAPPEAFALVEAFTAGGASCCTVEPAAGETLHGDPALSAAGVGALVALPIAAPAPLRCILVVADVSPRVPPTEVVELLELLGAQAGTSLRTIDAVAELRQQAETDPLTGLGHHATFHRALAAARVEGASVAVLVADVDGFKGINDARGHQAGDRVLREIASSLSAALRRGDGLFRLGGDEFAALVAVGDHEEALEAGRRLRDAVAATGSATISIGVALPYPGESDEALVARADRALYAVKQAGRDGVALDG